MSRDQRIDDYIAARAPFARPVLDWLRARVHAACPDVEESIKWGMPSFLLEGRLLAGMAAFKGHATFGFWDREATATGREGEAMGQYGRITSLDDLPDAATIEAQVRAAAALIRAGSPPRRPSTPPKPEADVPEPLASALADDDAARATFDAFPPSARRDYCDWIAGAKRPETRDRRVAETIVLLRAGKRRHWKYESC